MKTSLKIFLVSVSLLTIWLIVIQFQSYSYPSNEELTQRINYLERVISEPLESGNDINDLGALSYEWMLFSYSYSSYALTNIAFNDSSFKERAIQTIKVAIEKVLKEPLYSPYNIDLPELLSDSIPDYSVLYLGHLNLMLGNYRLLSSDTTYNSLNNTISKSLFDRYSNTDFLNLESYPYSIWIPDNTVALASLKLHSANTGSEYERICNAWVIYAKKNYIDPKTGVLYSTVNTQTGEPDEEPRGSMLGWSISFIYQFDSVFAQELYQNYKKNFSHNYLALRLFKERYDSQETNTGDIDSGPIFFGYSIPANEFALSNAVLAKDFKTAKKIERLIDWGTSTITQNDELKYEVRFLDLTISPMAEALVLHSLTITKWIDQ